MGHAASGTFRRRNAAGFPRTLSQPGGHARGYVCVRVRVGGNGAWPPRRPPYLQTSGEFFSGQGSHGGDPKGR